MLEIKKLPQSTVELRGEIAARAFESCREPALAALGREVKLPGFRPGHIPGAVLVRELGEETVLRRMAELILSQEYPKLLAENKIDALGRPNISLTKIAAGNPLGFIITTAVHPEIKLPDYRALARAALTADGKDSPSWQEESLPSVTEEEITAVIKNLEKMPAKDRPDFSEADLRTKIRDGLTQEKKLKARDRRRLKIIEKILSATPIDLPPILVESELDTMLAEMKHEVDRLGLPFNKYLEHLKKTEADLKRDWVTQAEHRVKTGLLLATIAKTENIKISKEELEMEMKHLLERHPSDSANWQTGRAQVYLAGLIANERVFELLETAAKVDKE